MENSKPETENRKSKTGLIATIGHRAVIDKILRYLGLPGRSGMRRYGNSGPYTDYPRDLRA